MPSFQIHSRLGKLSGLQIVRMKLSTFRVLFRFFFCLAEDHFVSKQKFNRINVYKRKINVCVRRITAVNMSRWKGCLIIISHSLPNKKNNICIFCVFIGDLTDYSQEKVEQQKMF